METIKVLDTEFYIPSDDEWRSAPENSKQGSGAPLPAGLGHQFTRDLFDYIDRGIELYERAMEQGVCMEQARLFLSIYGTDHANS